MLVYIVRHGQTFFGDDGLYLRDAGLTALGRKQARLVASRLADAGIEAAFTSHLKRAAETALEFERVTSITPVTVPTLAEIDSGDVYNAGRAVKAALANGEWRGGFEQFGGESIPTFAERAGRCFSLAMRLADEQGAGRVALFAHGGVTNAILNLHAGTCPAIDTRPYMPNCAYAVLDTSVTGDPFPGVWETAHLGDCVT